MMKSSQKPKAAPRKAAPQRKKATKKPIQVAKRALTTNTKSRTTMVAINKPQQFIHKQSIRKIVTELKDPTEARQFIVDKSSGKKLTVVDFYADWCGPCRTLGPQFKALSDEYPNAAFAKINADEFSAPDVADNFPEVTALPTVMFFVDGSHVDTVVGLNMAKISSNITKYQV